MRSPCPSVMKSRTSSALIRPWTMALRALFFWWSFSRYILLSASLNKAFISTGPSRLTAKPVDKLMGRMGRFALYSAMRFFMRRQALSINLTELLVIKTTNSSPPIREMMSPERKEARRISATLFRISSPASCPSESLMIFRPSTSHMSRPTWESRCFSNRRISSSKKVRL